MRLPTAALLLVAASTAALIVPVVLQGGVPAGHDAQAHLTYAYLFDRAIAEGQFPVRWTEWVREGHGQPLFNFYQPGFFYFVQAVHLGVPSLLLSLKLTVVLLWWLGATFIYLLFRRLGRLPAAMAALVFTWSPYMMLDVFVRTAYPELAGITFGVGVLWALDRALTTKDSRWLIAVASLTALLAISHPPTLLIFCPVIAAYAAYLYVTHRTDGRTVSTIVPAALLGLGLSAFYLLPAVMELRLIKSGTLTRDLYDFHNHFVLPKQWMRFDWGYGASIKGARDGMSFQIGIGQWMVIASSIVMLATTRARDLAFWFGITLLTLFFMTDGTLYVWETLRPMAFIQYPWRLLMLVSVGVAAMAAHVVAQATNAKVRAAVVMSMTVLLVLFAQRQLVPRDYITARTMDIDWQDWGASKQALENAHLEPGYYPATLQHAPAETVGRWAITKGRANVREIVVKGHDLDLEVNAGEPAHLQINSPAFPGWTLFLDNQRVDSVPGGGYLGVDVPPGTHRVRAIFADTRLRWVANSITIASAAIALVAIALTRQRW